MKTNQAIPTCRIYAALDLHCTHSVLGSMDPEGRWLGTRRFATSAGQIEAQVAALGGEGVCLTLEASALTRWAAGLLRAKVGRLVVCEPRHNRLIHGNANKCDEQDVRDLCLLLRMGKLKEVWMGSDRARQIHRELVYELLNWRDAQRELKALIKARYRQWGVLRVEGGTLFTLKGRDTYLAQLPGEEERRILSRLYTQHDHAMTQWRDTLREVRRAGRQFWEIAEFQKVPGIGAVGAHVFSAIVEEPARFAHRNQLIKYARLAITRQSSDGKPLGYQRLDRSGHRELKTLSYHAWRTATKSTTRDNAVKSYYQASRERTHDVRHARLNTQRKILETLWLMWRRRESYRDDKFFPSPPAGSVPAGTGPAAPAAKPGVPARSG
ncbi:MAG: transposase [Burkholderiales bacterium]